MLRIRLLQGFSWFSFYQKQDINYTGKHQKKSLTNNISARPIFHAYIIIIMYARKGTGLLHTHCSRPCSPFLSSTSRHPDYTIIVFALFLAKVGRPVAMPSTSRTLPISEKFCKAQGHFFWHRTQNKIKILPKFLGEGHSLASLKKRQVKRHTDDGYTRCSKKRSHGHNEM